MTARPKDKDNPALQPKRAKQESKSPEEKKRVCERIFDALVNGMSLRKICEEEKITASNFIYWINADKELFEQYARAKELRAEVLFNEMFDIADDACEDDVFTEAGNRVANNEWISRSKLRVDVRKWALSKLLPKQYGDKLDVEQSGEVNIVITSFKKEQEDES